MTTTVSKSKGIGDKTCTMYLSEHVCILYDKLNRPIEVQLTATEWKIMEVLLKNMNHVVSYTQLTLMVWGPDYLEVSGRPLAHWHVKNLRDLIMHRTGRAESPIQTVRGFGYKWKVR